MTINSNACGTCNTCYHHECAGMNLTISASYVKILKWNGNVHDAGCQTYQTQSLIDSAIWSNYTFSTDSDEMIAKSKAKSLKIMTLNFQNMFLKKDEINDSSIDIILDCENHLSLSVSTSELFSTVYAAYGWDRDDGWIDGDFNLLDIDWEIKSIIGSHYLKFRNKSFIETLDLCNSDQLVNSTTRKNPTLDLLITNTPSFAEKCLPIPDFGDHNTAISLHVACQPKCSKQLH